MLSLMSHLWLLMQKIDIEIYLYYFCIGTFKCIIISTNQLCWKITCIIFISIMTIYLCIMVYHVVTTMIPIEKRISVQLIISINIDCTSYIRHYLRSSLFVFILLLSYFIALILKWDIIQIIFNYMTAWNS